MLICWQFYILKMSSVSGILRARLIQVDQGREEEDLAEEGEEAGGGLEESGLVGQNKGTVGKWELLKKMTINGFN